MIQRLRNRLRQIKRFTDAGRGLEQKFGLFVIALARGHQFNDNDWFGRLGKRWFPSVVCRTRASGDLAIEVDTSDLGHLVTFQEAIIDGGYDLDKVTFSPSAVPAGAGRTTVSCRRSGSGSIA